jgi:hypothetical protein
MRINGARAGSSWRRALIAAGIAIAASGCAETLGTQGPSTSHLVAPSAPVVLNIAPASAVHAPAAASAKAPAPKPAKIEPAAKSEVASPAPTPANLEPAAEATPPPPPATPPSAAVPAAPAPPDATPATAKTPVGAYPNMNAPLEEPVGKLLTPEERQKAIEQLKAIAGGAKGEDAGKKPASAAKAPADAAVKTVAPKDKDCTKPDASGALPAGCKPAQ